MKKPTQTVLLSALALACVTLVGCASMGANVNADVKAMMQRSFRDQGIAKVDRLNQDRSNEACSEAAATGKPLPDAVSKAIEDENLKRTKLPSNGVYLGAWQEGEKIAQSGRGMTWTDASTASKDNGGNCYNCHQISKAEISFGTIGPSLYNYGKLRGVADPTSAAAQPVVQYTWQKILNAKAFNACSDMPRFAHMLDEDQVRHLMALLLDPKSPVNQ